MRETCPYLMVYLNWQSADSSIFKLSLSRVSPLCKELSDRQSHDAVNLTEFCSCLGYHWVLTTEASKGTSVLPSYDK